jgi:lipoprotein-releasing system permease protein
MEPPLYIAVRFLCRRTRSLLLSVSGVVLGVAFFICTQAQTQGFEKFFIETTLGTSGAIVISDRFQQRYAGSMIDSSGGMVSLSGRQSRKYYEGITDAYRVMAVIRQFSSVAACAPVVMGNATARTSFKSEVIRLQGIDLPLHMEATSLRSQVVSGNMDDFKLKPQGILLGQPLADKLEVKVGDNIYLMGPDGENRTFNVSGLFLTGINVIDETRAYVHRGAAHSLLRKPYATSTIIVKMRAPERAPEMARRLEDLLKHRARSWQERERGNLQIFQTIRLSAAVTVSTIILLAGFGIFNILTMMVLDKVKDIAILRSMGYTRGDISAIFLWQGVLVAAAGSALGCAMGAAMTWGISMIPVKVRGFFRVDHFVVDWNTGHYFQAVLIAFVAVLIASYFPARRASRLAPVAILRGSGQ